MRPDEINKIVEYIKEQTNHKGDIFININNNAIPIKWIIDWLTRQHVPATHTCDDYEAVEMMLDDWEKENE